jgi:hypothetical protein
MARAEFFVSVDAEYSTLQIHSMQLSWHSAASIVLLLWFLINALMSKLDCSKLFVAAKP